MHFHAAICLPESAVALKSTALMVPRVHQLKDVCVFRMTLQTHQVALDIPATFSISKVLHRPTNVTSAQLFLSP